ncbi:uncharacterized protein LOC6550254 [Drosophila erecta]|uniref:Uncharacterized protein n=1 Tax=Drosophila erecta TaxID=7220 RepID=B3NTF6_DROER|nr:uncharacterized protein LOC6550254 [Drosophila erecta]EDV46607.1 uncharacterized protein Dere_GG18109 [Drosophila erecta]
MNKYFNTEILHSLVSQVHVDNQDVVHDRFAAMEPAARYVLYISSDPCKELHPRNVKKNLRNLFGKEATSHGCVVRIREEKLSVSKLDSPKVAEPKSLDNVNEKSADAICTRRESMEGGFEVDTKATPSASVINLDERARGGLNITLFEIESQSNWTENRLEKYTEGQVEPKEPSFMTSQMSIQETSSQSSQEDDLDNFQLTEEALFDYLKHQWNQYHRLGGARSYLDWLRNSDCDIIKWLCRKYFIGTCMTTTSIEPVRNPTHPSHLEKFRNGLCHCLRVVGQFFSGEEEPADHPIRPYVDREHYAPLVLGPTIDESMAFLADRVMIAINWAKHRDVRPSAIAEEPE